MYAENDYIIVINLDQNQINIDNIFRRKYQYYIINVIYLVKPDDTIYVVNRVSLNHNLQNSELLKFKEKLKSEEFINRLNISIEKVLMLN
jgi:hypothetical protein